MEEKSGMSSVRNLGLLLKNDKESWRVCDVNLIDETILSLQCVDDPKFSQAIDLPIYSLSKSQAYQTNSRPQLTQSQSLAQLSFTFALIPTLANTDPVKFGTKRKEDYLYWINTLSPLTYPNKQPMYSDSQAQNTKWRLSAPENHIGHNGKNSLMCFSSPATIREDIHWLPTSPRVNPAQDNRKKTAMGLTRKAYSLKGGERVGQRAVITERQRHKTVESIEDYHDRQSGSDYQMENDMDATNDVMLALRDEELLARASKGGSSRSHELLHGIIDELVISDNSKGPNAAWIAAERVGQPSPPVSTAGHRRLSPTQIEIMLEQDEEKQLTKLKKKYVTPGDPKKKYTLTNQTIGKGSVGEVLFATRGEKKVAIKKLELIRRGRDRLPLILREIEIIATSAHPNIVEYIETYDMGEELWVVMEYMSSGSLYDLVKLYNSGIHLNEEHASYAIRNVLEALAFLHSKSRIHRDIKVDNILLDKDGSVKLADFGTAVQLTFQRLQRNTLAGTPYYMAPELIQRIPYKEKVDIWSVGITIIELMTGRPPFYHLEPEEALEAIVKHGVRGLGAKQFTEEIRDFTNRCCLAHDPVDRFPAKELLKHEFIQKACTKSEFAQFLGDINKSHTPQLEEVPKSGCILL